MRIRMTKTDNLIVLIPSLAILVSAASFDYPMGVAVDSKGQIYVADQELHSVLVISEGGKVSTLAKGTETYRTPLYRVRAISLDRQGQVFVADPASSEIYRVTREGKSVPLASGKLSQPLDLSVTEQGDLIVADLGANAIYRVSKDGAARQIAQVPAPRAVAVDHDGTFVVISGRGLVRVSGAGKVDKITAGDAFEFPGFVAVAGTEYIVSDGYAKAVVKVNHQGKATVLAKGEPLKNPQGVAVDSKGDVLVADPAAKTIFRISAAGKVTAVASAGAQ